MPVIINGTTGISGTDGSAATPAVQGTDANTGMFFPAADQIAFAEGGTEVMRIDASGNVGIGTSSPSAPVDVQANSNAVGYKVRGRASDNYSLIEFVNNANNVGYAYIGCPVPNTLAFFTNGLNERARITDTGLFQFNSGYGSVATAFGCRAWVNFNGTGTVAIRASGNVSSITDNGTGDYTINFGTAMPDANYAFTTHGVDLFADGFMNSWGVGPNFSQTSSSIRLQCMNDFSGAGFVSDIPTACVAIFR